MKFYNISRCFFVAKLHISCLMIKKKLTLNERISCGYNFIFFKILLQMATLFFSKIFFTRPVAEQPGPVYYISCVQKLEPDLANYSM
jgi:hypothetical protein